MQRKPPWPSSTRLRRVRDLECTAREHGVPVPGGGRGVEQPRLPIRPGGVGAAGAGGRRRPGSAGRRPAGRVAGGP